MPTYQMSPSYDSTEALGFIQKVYHLFLPTYVWYVFVMLLGFYILLRAFNFKVWLSALGAIIWAFSSYFFIIIAAGHIWKFVTLAYIPPTIAGMVLVYRGKYLVGGLVTALFVALQIMANHPQMSYYFLFVMLFMAIAYGVMAYKENKLKDFFKATGVLVVAGVIGVCINLSNLYHTYQYSKESMRGKSELPVELWHRRNILAACSKCERRGFRTFGCKRRCDEEGQSDVSRTVLAVGTVLGRTAWHFRSGLRRCIRDVPFHTGMFHSERSYEMGFDCGNNFLYCIVVGKEFHGCDRLLHRLCSYVQ